MTKEKLQNITAQFDEKELKEKALFGILQYGGGPDESFIKANKEGLELFALELLKSASETENILADKERKSIPFNYVENYIDEESNTFIDFIEPIDEKQNSKQKEVYKETFAEKLIPYGCGLTILILAISTLVGLITILDWLSGIK